MRWRTVVNTIAAMLAFGLVGAMPAAAADLGHSARPHGWGHERVIKHHVYYPRYRHVYHVHYATDPYAYRPAARGYYPYYNSAYWHPATYRPRPYYQLPAYYPAWGYTNRNWQHKKWHKQHHGHHYPWHW